MARLLVAVIGLFVGSCTVAPVPPTVSPEQATPTAVPAPESPGIVATPLVEASPPTSAPLRQFANGEFRVGVDIDSGTYRAIEPIGEFCYWERVSGFGGSDDELIANSAGVGPRVVTIAATDAGFISTDCGVWTADLSPLPGPLGDGVWIVGTDIQPGTYTSTDDGSLCYWERLSGFGGTPDEVIDSRPLDGITTVEIMPTDQGFGSSRCGTWEPD
jgi:hypothetical protein